MEYVLPCRQERMRAEHPHPHSRSTKAPTSSNQRGPSHAFGPRAQAAPLPVVRLIHNRGSATAAPLNITITVTITVKQATQNTTILSLRTTKPASPNRRMPSQAFRPIAQAVLPYIVGLIYSKAPVAAASLNIVITMTTAIW